MDDHDQPLPPRLCDWNLDVEPTRPAAGETLVLRVDLDPRPESAEFEQLLQWEVLSEEERVRARRFVRPRDGRRFAVCRGSLRLILGQLTSIPPPAIAFRFGPGGKPELVPPRASDHAHWLRFNVTHSDELALIAVSLDRELGVDLERQRTISEAARIVGSYFTADEQVHFAALEERTSQSAFLRGWTRKEAILKAKGVGLAGLATSYETMFGSFELGDRFQPAEPFPRIGEWWLWEAAPRAGYCAALAVQDVALRDADVALRDTHGQAPGSPAHGLSLLGNEKSKNESASQGV